MKDHHESDPKSETGEGAAKPGATIHSLDEWRTRRRTAIGRSAGKSGRRNDGRSRPYSYGPGPGRGYSGYGGYGNDGRYGGYGGYGGADKYGRPGNGYGGYSGFPYGRGTTYESREYGRSGGYGAARQKGNSRVTSIHGGAVASGGRWRRRIVMVLTVVGIIGLLTFVLRAMGTVEVGPMVDPPAVLHVLVADGRPPDDDLAALLSRFEASHNVVVQWRSSPAEEYNLYHDVLVGPAPDVILLDMETLTRLLAMDALLEIGGETVRVSPTQAAIPRHARNPELARLFLQYLSEAVPAVNAEY